MLILIMYTKTTGLSLLSAIRSFLLLQKLGSNHPVMAGALTYPWVVQNLSATWGFSDFIGVKGVPLLLVLSIPQVNKIRF